MAIQTDAKAEISGRGLATIVHRWWQANTTLKPRDYIRIGLVTVCCVVAAPVLSERAHNPAKRGQGDCLFFARVPLIGWPLLACDTPLNDIATLFGVTFRSGDNAVLGSTVPAEERQAQEQ
jgi:hypothetical protein